MATQPTHDDASAASEDPQTTPVRLQLLGRFRLWHRRSDVAMPRGSEHLVAFVALRHQAVDRTLVAGTLWPEVPQPRAYATLRSALARLGAVSREALRVDHDSLSLAQGVTVDLHEARALAFRLLDPTPASVACDLGPQAIAALSLELLPGWYDDWAVLEAEDWRDLRLHALEAMAVQLSALSRFGEATAAASAAIRAEPLRESAHSVLIGVDLAEGNRSGAMRHYERYQRLLHEELGLQPTLALRELVANL